MESMDFSRPEYWNGKPFPSPGDLPNLGISNPGLLLCGRILYQLSQQRSPRILKWIAYPFSRGTSRPRDRTGVSCIAGGFLTNWAIREAWIIRSNEMPSFCLINLRNSRSALDREESSWAIRVRKTSFPGPSLWLPPGGAALHWTQLPGRRASPSFASLGKLREDWSSNKNEPEIKPWQRDPKAERTESLHTLEASESLFFRLWMPSVHVLSQQ